MLVCLLLKRTSGHLNSKSLLRVFLMTRATKKEQATTSLKTNSMNVNHVEYKQGFKNDLQRNLSQVSGNSCNLLKFGKWFLSILRRKSVEYFNLRIAKYGWRNIAVGCCENHSNIYTANEEAVLKSILLVSLNNSSTLLFILDYSGLKIGNCCWLVLLFGFPARLFIKNSGQAPSQVGFKLFHLSYRYLTISGEECSDQ